MNRGRIYLKRIKAIIRAKAFTVMLVLFYTFSFAVELFILNYLHDLYLLDRSGDDKPSGESLTFVIASESKDAGAFSSDVPFEADFSFTDSIDKDYTLYYEQPNNKNGCYYAVCLNSGIKLRSGRIFNNDDRSSDENLAIVGEDLSEQLGSDVIEADSTEHKIIGVCDKDIHASDYRIYLLSKDIKHIAKNSVFTLVCDSSKALSQISGRIKDELTDQGFEYKEIESDKARFSDFLKVRRPVIVLAAILGSIILCVIIAVNLLWLNSKVSLMIALYYIGKPRAKLTIFKSFCVINLFALVISVAAVYLLTNAGTAVLWFGGVVFIFTLAVFAVVFLAFHKDFYRKLTEMNDE